MQSTAKLIAEQASFKAFLNCYVREMDVREVVRLEEAEDQEVKKQMNEPYILFISLPHQSLTYAIGVTYKSLVGTHSFGNVYKQSPYCSEWVQEEKLQAMITLIRELHMRANAESRAGDSHFDELLLRLIDSYQTMAQFIDHAIKKEETASPRSREFIDFEQSLVFGHWLHPTPKSRQGIASWQHERFSPEKNGHFQLHYFKVNNSLIVDQSDGDASCGELLLRELEIREQPPGWSLLPVHPLQAQWLITQPQVKTLMDKGLIEEAGAMGPEFYATSSIRTVYNKKSNWMFKFSIPVKVTNSLRNNQKHELYAGRNMTKLLKKLPLLKEYPSFQFIYDPAFLTVNIPGMKESGFEVIIRSNPFTNGNVAGVTPIAALIQDALPGRKSMLQQLIEELAMDEGRSQEDVSFDWFKNYFEKTVIPLIHLYDTYGIALEAHQQNSLIDLSAGYPASFYYRDNQGYYLSTQYRERLLKMEESLQKTPELFYEEKLIEERFTYYLFINHLFSIVYRFGADGLLEENVILDYIQDQLKEMYTLCHGAGKRLLEMLLTREKLAFKANLLTRFHDVDELTAALEQAVYATLDNPFTSKEKGEVPYAGRESAKV
ncbi:IucA/IucC family protein [Alkalihalophilus pseudofirmus]|uniref:IucA/IucC family protein n=1 Tax=Alkalihalophilus pseudofirmus TaxID=79885 RepID=A0AAJ2NRB0_ALKPS|nr:IucA/IucC family protein [Alkalihalophilus pseudofirmus]MDV2887066.1 IucA/IucC family protein [Alkalihalophilus pseudofirmus]